jgi:hypothetical protein
MSSTHRHLLLDFFWQVISGPPCIYIYINICMGKDTFEEICSTEWYFRGEFGNFEELLEIPCNGKVPLRYQDLIGMCCPLHELTLYRHCNEFNLAIVP